MIGGWTETRRRLHRQHHELAAELPTIGGAPQIGNRPPNEEEMRYCCRISARKSKSSQPALLVALRSTARRVCSASAPSRR